MLLLPDPMENASLKLEDLDLKGAPIDEAPVDDARPKEAGLGLYVVGVGASAGGLEALENFFEHVPIDCGMAFVVVQHLSPDFKSLMDEILSRRTRLPVHPVEDGMRVEANHIYLIPAKKEMIISQGRLLLSERSRNTDLALPIDVFFRSLAQDCGTRAVAVVLSGGGSDGSRGICDVHDAGGLVLVQDAESAQFDGMPRAARDAGVADCVLAPHEMPSVFGAARYAGGHTRLEARRRRSGQPDPGSARAEAKRPEGYSWNSRRRRGGQRGQPRHAV